MEYKCDFEICRWPFELSQSTHKLNSTCLSEFCDFKVQFGMKSMSLQSKFWTKSHGNAYEMIKMDYDSFIQLFSFLSYIYFFYWNQNYGFAFFDSTESSVWILRLFSEKRYCFRSPAGVLSIFTVFISMNVFQLIVPVGQVFAHGRKRSQLGNFPSTNPKVEVKEKVGQ